MDMRAVLVARTSLWLAGVAALAHAAPPKPADAGRPWAFRAPVRPAVPTVQDAAWVRNPIDGFIRARQEEAGLRPAPPASRTTLVRRLSFDLLGLPPTPEEVDAFVRNPAPDAYERLVDRLLASPRYGEHWATYWLDLARFAQTDGFKADDPRPAAWRYRDYVIRAFNADKPYDRFVQQQLAGDELFPDDLDALVATGFNRNWPDEYNAVNLEQRRQEILNDMTDTTALVFLGLTVGCARCHDHKYDPISQKDYYRVQAFFAAFQPADMPLAGRADVEQYRRQLAEWQAKTADLRRQMSALEEPYRGQFFRERKRRFPREYQQLLDIPTEKRTPLQQQLASMVLKQVESTSGEAVQRMKPEVRKQWQALAQQLAAFDRSRPQAPPAAMALTDVGAVAPATHRLRRGEWDHPGKAVRPGFLSALDGRPAPAAHPGQHTTGRRSVLARWLTDPRNPLTARVMVNRLWQHHFGRGIVATPSDFGSQGEPPTHPELLDWLAVEFRESGWSLKHMHRLIVLSATYRQSCIADCGLRIADSSSIRNLQSAIRNRSDPQSIDPDNRLLWRMNRRRLEGEALRDAMLAVSGELNLKMGGPGIYPELPAEMKAPRTGWNGWPTSADPAERHRRSVYVFVKRNLRYPLLTVFDATDRNETCPRRNVSTNAPQALTLLNDRVVLDRAKALARRVLCEAGPDHDRLIDRACRLTLGRPPDAEEARLMHVYLGRETERRRGRGNAGTPAVTDLCHALLNLNEFIYVD
jgi:hypothetical protein